MFQSPVKTHSQDENAPSPAKAILVTPPRSSYEAFFFKNTKGKTEGLTPKGKTKVPLTSYEGPYHLRMRRLDNPSKIVGKKPLAASDKSQFEEADLLFMVSLSNLKKRADHDFEHFKKGGIEEKHYLATKIEIKSCIEQFKHCRKLAPNRVDFIKELNRLITNGAIYNPYGLSEIYHDTGYQVDLATDPTVYKKAFVIPVIPASVTRGKAAGGLYEGLPPIQATQKALIPQGPTKGAGLFDGLPEPKNESQQLTIQLQEPKATF